MKITIIGAGNMGGAIARGLLRSHLRASDLTIAKFAPSAPDTIFTALGCRSAIDPIDACSEADIIIVAVKPWLADHILQQIKPHCRAALIVSVMGGVGLDQIAEHFSGAVFRAIPNTAAAVGRSITFLSSHNATPEQTMAVRTLFESVGEVMELPEDKMEAATALGSCGIAFAMRYVRASIQGAVEMGLPPTVARHIAAHTIAGAAEILLSSHTHPEAELDRVTTAGGITIKGLNTMEDRGFSSSVIAGLKACKK